MKTLAKVVCILFFIYLNLFAKNLDKVTIRLQWLDQFQFAGYYIAKEKGFYKDLNLDVNFIKHTNDSNIVNSVVNNEATFATGRTSLLIYKDHGYPIVALAAIFQHSPACLISTNEEIHSVEDLKNKKIMITQNAITSASYMSMLFSEGLTLKELDILPHTHDLNDLINKKTDAMAAYISNEPFILEKKGIAYRYFQPKDYGFDFYGDILFTSKYQLLNYPTRVRNFTMASLKGWEYAFQNIEETAKLIYKKYNSQNKSLEQLIYEGKVLKKLAFDKNGELGHIDLERFKDIAKVYRLLGVISKQYSLSDFIYCVHCKIKNSINFNKKENNWLMENKTVKVASNKSWQPIEFFDKNNLYSGIASGYLKLLEKKIDIKFKIEKNAFWYQMIEKIKNKDIDMFLSIVKTPKRQEYMNFTTPYLSFPTVILTKQEEAYIRDFSQLSNKTIAVEKGFYTQELIKKFNNKIKLLKVNTTEEAIKKVYKNEAYAYIGALPNIGYFLKKLNYTNLKINGEAPFETTLSFSTRLDLPILNSILQKALNSISKEEHDKIYNDWINIQYEYNMNIDYKIITIYVLVAIIIFILLYYRSIVLKKELRLRERFTNKLKKLNKLLESKNKNLKYISESDSLTKIANRRKLDAVLEIEINRAKRNNIPLSIILIDIDFFKQVNDNFGHKSGDVVLIELSKLLNHHLRKYDFLGRWGGEEFLIICPQSDIEQTIQLALKLNKLVKEYSFQVLKNKKLTISCGVSQLKKDMTIDDLINVADDQLYISKNMGRDCVNPKLS